MAPSHSIHCLLDGQKKIGMQSNGNKSKFSHHPAMKREVHFIIMVDAALRKEKVQNWKSTVDGV